ncbi:MAG: cell division protein ZapA [Deltaproteobacteria bacterium]|nr:cell division protein ZapA [Deltaproteobacteria bacterium]
MTNKVCEINILGNKYSMRSDEGVERIREIESFVNQHLQEVLEKSKSLSLQNATILAALNIAGEFFKLKDNQKDYQEGVVRKSKDILKWIDNQLEEAKGVDVVV